MNLKPFDLQKALAGDPVVTRDGRKVTEIIEFKTACNTLQNTVAVIDGHFYSFYENGKCMSQWDSEFDLFMAPKIVKKSGWLNVYPNNTVGFLVHPTKEIADIHMRNNRMTCAYFEWEEEEKEEEEE